MHSRSLLSLLTAWLALFPCHLLAVPLILAQPTTKHAFPSAVSATFEVMAVGSPAPTYQWQVKVGGTGSASNIIDDASYSGATTATLTINSPAPGMSGNTYQCVVTSGSAVTSVSAPLICYPAPTLTPVFTVTPGSQAANSTAGISLLITGLSTAEPSGDSVRIERVLDLNGNGNADIGEPLVQSFQVTDGQVSSFGGVRNPNIPGDDDVTRDGKISTHISLTDAGRSAGSYLIEISSPSGTFKPVTKTHTITQPSHGQSVSGQVTCGGAPVLNAMVAALDLTNDGQYVASAVADSSGNYTLNLPAGAYMLLGVQTGYVAPLATAPTVTLGATQTLTGRNVALTAATCTIAGTLRDGPGTTTLKGMHLYSETDNDNDFPSEIALTYSDTDGNFVVAALAGLWTIGAESDSLALLGYLEPDDDVMASTAVGTTTALDLQYTAATALVYGTVTDTHGTPMPGVSVNASDNPANLYWIDARTDASGNYFMGITGTASWWWIGPDDESPALAGSIPPDGKDITPTTNSATRVNFTARPVTAHLQGTVTLNGVPVAGVTIVARPPNGNSRIATLTGSNGEFDLGVMAGTWNVSLDLDDTRANNLASPILQQTIADNQTIAGIAYQVVGATGTISGGVKDIVGNPLENHWVYASATINNIYYEVGTDTDANGYYSFPVINGTWMLGVNSSIYFPQQTVAVTGSAQVDFTPLPVVAHLQGKVQKNGVGASGVLIAAWQNSGGILVTTDSNGNFDFGVTSTGAWSIGLVYHYAISHNLIGARLTETVTHNQTIANIILPIADGTGTISGSIKDSGGNSLVQAGVYANATINDVFYYADAQTDSNGNYSFPVINGTWTVGVSSPIYFSPQTVAVTGSAQVDFPATPVQLWRQTVFNSTQRADPNISGLPAMVPSGAGFTNLVAYALGLNPNTAKATELPTLGNTSTSGNNYQALKFTRNTAATDIAYAVQASSNLLQWDTISSYRDGTWSQPGFVSESGSTPNINVQVRDSLPVQSAPRRFLRLQVTHW
jgi:hypothetical protein